MKNPSNPLISIGLAVITALALPGCGDLMPGRYDTVIVVDRSGSVRGNQRTAQALRGVGKVYLTHLGIGAKNTVTIRFGGNVKELACDGRGTSLRKMRDELDALADQISTSQPASTPAGVWPKPGHHHDPKLHVPVLRDAQGHGLEMGSPIVESLLTPVTGWIKERPSGRELMAVIISDLVADPTVYRDGCVQHYLDPSTFRWKLKDALNVHLRFYMVGEDVKNALRGAWSDTPADTRFFEPGHEVDKDDLKPPAGGTSR